MSTPGSYRGMLNEFKKLPEDNRNYLKYFPSLAKDYPWDVSIAHLYSRVELAQNMTIYCGVVKRHRVDTELAWKAVDNQHMKRDGFREIFESVFSKPVPRSASAHLTHAEKIRDKILHGKSVTGADKREAVYDILYSKEFNDALQSIEGFRPFGSLQGFKGRGKALDKATSRWVLKGIGFTAFQ